MPNPFKNAGITNNLGNAISMAKGMSNPMVALQQMAKTNPQVAMVVNALQSGGNPQQLFTQLCQQQGIDPNTILSMLK